jgi:hypothetical protein
VSFAAAADLSAILSSFKPPDHQGPGLFIGGGNNGTFPSGQSALTKQSATQVLLDRSDFAPVSKPVREINMNAVMFGACFHGEGRDRRRPTAELP